MTDPKLSIVIPVHNGAATLPAQLDGIGSGIRDDGATEIIVVDNRSSDGTGQVAEEWADRTGLPVRVEPAAERAGEPYARNVGARASRAAHLAYCDADDIVSPTWAAAMMRGLARSEYVTGPVDTEALNEPWLAHVRGREPIEATPRLYASVPFAHGCNIGIRKSTLEALGGFDESYLIGCDVELAIRAWRAGVELGFEPDALVHYRLRPSVKETYLQGRAYGQVRRRFRRLLDDEVDAGAERRANARRVGWLVKNLPRLGNRRTRARWAWVAAQLDGEARALVAARRGHES